MTDTDLRREALALFLRTGTENVKPCFGIQGSCMFQVGKADYWVTTPATAANYFRDYKPMDVVNLGEHNGYTIIAL